LDDYKYLLGISPILAAGYYIGKKVFEKYASSIPTMLNVGRLVCKQLVKLGKFPLELFKYLITTVKTFLSYFYKKTPPPSTIENSSPPPTDNGGNDGPAGQPSGLPRGDNTASRKVEGNDENSDPFPPRDSSAVSISSERPVESQFQVHQSIAEYYSGPTENVAIPNAVNGVVNNLDGEAQGSTQTQQPIVHPSDPINIEIITQTIDQIFHNDILEMIRNEQEYEEALWQNFSQRERDGDLLVQGSTSAADALNTIVHRSVTDITIDRMVRVVGPQNRQNDSASSNFSTEATIFANKRRKEERNKKYDKNRLNEDVVNQFNQFSNPTLTEYINDRVNILSWQNFRDALLRTGRQVGNVSLGLALSGIVSHQSYDNVIPNLSNQPFANSTIQVDPVVESRSETNNQRSVLNDVTLNSNRYVDAYQRYQRNTGMSPSQLLQDDSSFNTGMYEDLLRTLGSYAYGSLGLASALTVPFIKQQITGEKGYGISKNIEDHEKNSNTLHDFMKDGLTHLSHLRPTKFRLGNLFKEHMNKQKPYQPLNYEKIPTKGCGFCGGNMDLLVHDKDINDYTCTPCYDKEKMTAGRFSSRQTKLYPIEDSKHEQHKNDNKQHKINTFLLALDKENPKTKFQEFDESANINKDWLKRYSKDYVMDRPYLKKDKDKLVYLLGMREHAPEFMSTELKANLQKMIFNHLKHEKPKPSIPQLDKFNTFDEINHQVTHGGGFLHYYRV